MSQSNHVEVCYPRPVNQPVKMKPCGKKTPANIAIIHVEKSNDILFFFFMSSMSSLANLIWECPHVPPFSIKAGRQRMSRSKTHTCGGIPCPCLDKCRNNPFSTFSVLALLAPAPAAIHDVSWLATHTAETMQRQKCFTCKMSQLPKFDCDLVYDIYTCIRPCPHG